MTKQVSLILSCLCFVGGIGREQLNMGVNTIRLTVCWGTLSQDLVGQLNQQLHANLATVMWISMSMDVSDMCYVTGYRKLVSIFVISHALIVQVL